MRSSLFNKTQDTNKNWSNSVVHISLWTGWGWATKYIEFENLKADKLEDVFEKASSQILYDINWGGEIRMQAS